MLDAILVLLITLLLATIEAGKDEYSGIPIVSPTWTAPFEQPVEWQRVTPMGHLVVATNCCLYGIDPTTGSVEWSLGGLTGVVEDSFEMIPRVWSRIASVEITRRECAHFVPEISADGRS